MRNNKLVMNISPLTAVTTHADRLVAVEQLAGVQTLRRDITEHYAGLKAPATQTTRAIRTRSSRSVGQPGLRPNSSSKHRRPNSLKRAAETAMTKRDARPIRPTSAEVIEAVWP